MSTYGTGTYGAVGATYGALAAVEYTIITLEAVLTIQRRETGLKHTSALEVGGQCGSVIEARGT